MVTSLVTMFVLGSLAIASAALYLLPVLIGAARRVPDLGAVAAIDILLGWTFAGWVVALAMALRSVTPAGPVMQFVQNLPPPPGPAGGAGWAGPLGEPPPRPDSPPPLVLPSRPAGPQGLL